MDTSGCGGREGKKRFTEKKGEKKEKGKEGKRENGVTDALAPGLTLIIL